MASTSFRKQVQKGLWLYMERVRLKGGVSDSQVLLTAFWIKRLLPFPGEKRIQVHIQAVNNG